VSGYTKLFNSIIGSTIWQENPATKVVWITMLTMRDKGGVVEASVPGLAKLAGVSIEEAEVALTKFLSPDPYSSSPENEGRRIERVDGGWRILNHYKYQEKMSKDDIRERDCIRQRQYREQKKCHREGVTKCDTRDRSPMSRHKDIDVPQPQNEDEPTPLGHSPNDQKVFSGSLPSSENGEEQTPEGVVNSPFTICAARAKQKERDVRSLKTKLTVLAKAIYDEYPRKVAKASGLRVIEKSIVTISKRGATENHENLNGDTALAADWLKSRVELYTNSSQGQRKDKEHIPYPATWFNRGQYDDDPSEWKNVGTSGEPKGSPVRELNCENPAAGFEDVLSRPKSAWKEGA
jgi:hypothetical protein